MFEKELQYFTSHKAELIKKYSDTFVVIVGETVIGNYLTEIEAYSDALAKKHELGSFLIMYCTDVEEKPQVFHSRVAFF